MPPEQSSNKIGKSVGEKLRTARIAHHYTQSQLAAPDFSVSYISAIERGQIHPSLRALEILASRLGLSSTQLLPAKAQAEERVPSVLHLAERDDDELELTFLEIQIALHKGQATEALNELEALSPKRFQRPHQLLHRFLQGWTFFQLGKYQECDYILSEISQLAKDLQAHYLHTRLLNIQAQAQAALRNYSQALLLHQHCLHILETEAPQDPFFHAQILAHLGHHFFQLAQYEQALEMYQKAITLTSPLQSIRDIQAIYTRICTHYTGIREYDLATLYAYKCSELSNIELVNNLRSEMYHRLGRTLMRLDSAQWQAFLAQFSEENSTANELLALDPLSHASILAQKGRWLYQEQQFQAGIQAAQAALDLLKPYGDSIIAADATLIRARLAYAQQDLSVGDQHFILALDMLERLGQHEELAEEAVHYADLLEEAGKVHEAFTYIRRAFQSQQKLGR